MKELLLNFIEWLEPLDISKNNKEKLVNDFMGLSKYPHKTNYCSWWEEELKDFLFFYRVPKHKDIIYVREGQIIKFISGLLEQQKDEAKRELIKEICQDVFNACALSISLDYLYNLKKKYAPNPHKEGE